ncbi:MAG TPA: VWA domain-containing protein [Candidatus Binatia bacterium]|jgi:Ca-activated chloride channel family protein
MRHNCDIPGKRLIGILTVALLFPGACTQKMEAPVPPAKAPSQSQGSSPPVTELKESAPIGRAETTKDAQSSPATPTAEQFNRRELPASRSGAAALHSYPYGPPPHYPYPRFIPQGVDRFPEKDPTGVLSVAEHPVSTFSVDVDSASYAFVRRSLTGGQMPPREAVRVEEMVNYFPYSYPAPQDRTQPFHVTTTMMPSPWSEDNQLLHIAIRGYDIARADRPRANVVLLIDTSGSMQPGDRLPLLQQGFRLFAQQLRDDDRVAIVTYAGEARTALEPMAGREKHKIIEVIDNLRAGGSTAGGEGLQRAYALAERHFDKQAVNRVILATDGDFNVGITDPKELERFIVAKRKTGIYLSIFGVGVGNLNDALMQRLAQAGNGNAAHIDSLLEARKAMSEELSSTIFPIADDVKIQVEFNPALVSEYRLIGYETRMLRREDFKDDKVDAGDIGAGHTVTAIYEITPAGAKQRRVDPLRYQTERDRVAPSTPGRGDELAFVKLRYKLPREATSRLIEQPVRAGAALKLDQAPAEQRFAVAVAAFAQRLRGESAVDSFTYAGIAALANAARGADPEGYRAEFVRLVRMAETLGAVAQR